jgi:hypothetical protein
MAHIRQWRMPILVSGAGFDITESNDAKAMFQYEAQ